MSVTALPLIDTVFQDDAPLYMGFPRSWFVGIRRLGLDVKQGQYISGCQVTSLCCGARESRKLIEDWLERNIGGKQYLKLEDFSVTI
jgi:hypothetical protein